MMQEKVKNYEKRFKDILTIVTVGVLAIVLMLAVLGWATFSSDYDCQGDAICQLQIDAMWKLLQAAPFVVMAWIFYVYWRMMRPTLMRWFKK